MSGQAIDFSKYESAAPATIDFSKYEASAPPPSSQPSAGERLTRSYNPDIEAFAEKHPILGIPARLFDSAGGAAINFLPSIYHAFTDPLTDEEKDNFKGHSQIPGEVVLERLTGGEAAVKAGQDYASGKVTPQGVLSVLPEALGGATGTVAAGETLARGAGPAKDAATNGAAKMIDAASQYGLPVARALAKTIDAASFDRISKIWNAWKNIPEDIRARGPQFSDPGAPLPEHPPLELLQARALTQGATAPAPEAAAGLGNLPATGAIAEPKPTYPGAPLPAAPPAEVGMAKGLAAGGGPAPKPQAAALADLPAPAVHQAAQELGPQATVAEVTDRANEIASGNTIPRTLSGDSALRQMLGGQDNANLMKIARSRGINVTQEAQLKPGVANSRLINKIVNDFGPDELDEVGAQALENSRFRHAFGEIGPEAWKTMGLQTYFPEVKVPLAVQLRTAKAIENAASNAPKFAPVGDVGKAIKEAAAPAASAPKPAPASEGDLTPQLQEMLKQALAKKKQPQSAAGQ